MPVQLHMRHSKKLAKCSGTVGIPEKPTCITVLQLRSSLPEREPFAAFFEGARYLVVFEEGCTAVVEAG